MPPLQQASGSMPLLARTDSQASWSVPVPAQTDVRRINSRSDVLLAVHTLFLARGARRDEFDGHYFSWGPFPSPYQGSLSLCRVSQFLVNLMRLEVQLTGEHVDMASLPAVHRIVGQGRVAAAQRSSSTTISATELGLTDSTEPDDEGLQNLFATLILSVYQLSKKWKIEKKKDRSMESFDMEERGELRGYSRLPLQELGIQQLPRKIRCIVYVGEPDQYCGIRGAPKVVVACRGTCRGAEDLLSNVKFTLQGLHTDDRFKELEGIMGAVRGKYGVSNVCVTGHSLGAAVGLQVAKKLAAHGWMELRAHLFNPPFVAFDGSFSPFVRGCTRLYKAVIRVEEKLAASAVSAVSKRGGERLTERLDRPHTKFWSLSEWTPVLYVNEGDHICNGYIHFMRSLRNVNNLESSSFEALYRMYVAPESVLGIFRMGSSPMHLIPSADLRIAKHSAHRLGAQAVDCHKLAQWSHPGIQVSKEVIKVSGTRVHTKELWQAFLLHHRRANVAPANDAIAQ